MSQIGLMPQGQRRTMARLVVPVEKDVRPQERERLDDDAGASSSEAGDDTSPFERANIFSKASFWWMNAMFFLGARKKLEQSDLFPLPVDDEANMLTDRLLGAWKREQEVAREKQRDAHIVYAFFRAFAPILLHGAMWGSFEVVFQIGQAVMIGLLVGALSSTGPVDATEAYLFAFGLCACTAGYALTHHIFFFLTMRAGMQMRIASIGAIMRKALNLSQASIASTTTGHIVNLVSTDVSRFDYFMVHANFLWIGPVVTAIVTYLAWRLVSWAVFAGLAFIFCIIPLQAVIGKAFARLRGQTTKVTDTRVKLMNEVISGIRVIKMYAWEKALSAALVAIRAKEMVFVRRTGRLRAANLALFFISPICVSFLTFLTFHFIGGELTPRRVFGTVSLLNVVRFAMSFFFPMAMANGNELLVTMRRMQDFLVKTEHGMVSEIDEGTAASTAAKNPTSDLHHTHSRRDGSLAHLMGSNLSRSSVNGTMYMVNLRDDDDDVRNASHQGEAIEMSTMTTRASQNATADTLSPVAHVHFGDVTCSWSDDVERPTLQDVSFKAEVGALTAIVGPVGAGKSTLLMAVMNEIPVSRGTVDVCGTIAYSAQEPWILAGTVRENILFGAPYDKDHYDEVVEVCALERDFELFPDGDQSDIGERGITLSGGQRARLSLARAVYAQADVYLLDDPLSAVDTRVGRVLFEKCLTGLLHDKVVLLVTHQVQYLTRCDNIVVLLDGKMTACGGYKELMDQGHNLHDLLTQEDGDKGGGLRSTSVCSYGSSSKRTASVAKGTGAAVRRRRRNTCSVGGESFSELGEEDEDDLEDDDNDNDNVDNEEEYVEPKTEKLTNVEATAGGSVTIKTYKSYFGAAGGLPISIIILILMLLGQAALMCADWWLSKWSTLPANERGDRNLAIYGIIVVTAIALAFTRALVFFMAMLRGSQVLHNKMFARVVRAPMSFFDSNPTGRVLNRFSKDTGFVDDLLPMTLFDASQSLLLCTGAVLLVVIVNPWVVLAVLPLGIVFWFLRRFYLQTARQLKRIEGTCRSPLYSQLSASLRGLSTIRAFQQQQRFANEFHTLQNIHGQAWFLFIATNRWLGWRLDFLSFVFVCAAALLAVAARDSIGGGLAGLSLTYAVQLTGLFQWTIRQTAEVENQMTSVERVVEYTKLPSEAALETAPEMGLPEKWPSEGRVSFDHVSLTYREGGAKVLRNLTFDIEGGEKIGVVGRTGAGKSSMLAALFRLAEYEGTMLIDGVPTNRLGLHDLRNSCSVIPQEPVLFSGSVRYNIDPFDQYSDDELWSALRAVQLEPMVEDLPGKLNGMLTESGGNLSVGQRQLVCLARAILRHSRILVMDEATANVDLNTDNLIQRTIRERFQECTVLTIAHRLNTIMDSDRVLVLDAGEAVEFAAPHELLQDSRSQLSSLVNELGRGSRAAVARQAWDHYQKRNSIAAGALDTAV